LLQKQRHFHENCAPASAALSLDELEHQATNWQLDGEVRQLSKGTIENRRIAADRLLWFLRHRNLKRCGATELRAFFAYLNTAHETADGRWGDANRSRPMRPAGVKFYFSRLRTFFAFLVEEGALDSSPMERLKPPIIRQDQVQPFTREQQEALRLAARRSRDPRRNEAILLLLLDTGLRASELCGLRVKDLDLAGRRCYVLGKGNKHRAVYFGSVAARALGAYLREVRREPEAPLFIAERGPGVGEPFTRSGLLQLMKRLGKAAKLEACRCSPHTFRHTFAVEFLRAGGNVFSLKELLGHTTLTMTQRYVALAQADIENQHRKFSPADRLRKPARR
jgi:integrase/recombinase XerC